MSGIIHIITPFGRDWCTSQRISGVQHRNDEAADHEAADHADLPGDLEDGQAERVAVARQDGGAERGAGALEGRVQRGDAEGGGLGRRRDPGDRTGPHRRFRQRDLHSQTRAQAVASQTRAQAVAL